MTIRLLFARRSDAYVTFFFGDFDNTRKCDNSYHLKCLNPPLSAVPEGEWFCGSCVTEIGAPIFGTIHEEKKFLSDPYSKGKTTTKRKASDAGGKTSGGQHTTNTVNVLMITQRKRKSSFYFLLQLCSSIKIQIKRDASDTKYIASIFLQITSGWRFFVVTRRLSNLLSNLQWPIPDGWW
jgi:PHD-finger